MQEKPVRPCFVDPLLRSMNPEQLKKFVDQGNHIRAIRLSDGEHRLQAMLPGKGGGPGGTAVGVVVGKAIVEVACHGGLWLVSWVAGPFQPALHAGLAATFAVPIEALSNAAAIGYRYSFCGCYRAHIICIQSGRRMNIFEGRWSKIKQELLPIIYLSVIQIWWSFNFPLYARAGAPWTTILGVGMSILGVVMYAIIFSSPQKFVTYLKFDQIDEALLYGHIIKKFMRLWMVIVGFLTMLIMWYKNVYHMPSVYYVLIYIHFTVFYILLFRAANREMTCEKSTTEHERI